MAVSPKFNVKFQRGDSAFNQLLGQFIGIRSKENKERYAMQIKAADPTEKLKILRTLIQDKNRLIRDMVKARQGVSITERTGGGGRGSSARAVQAEKFRNENKNALESKRKGALDAQSSDELGRIKSQLSALKTVLQRDPPPSEAEINAQKQSFITQAVGQLKEASAGNDRHRVNGKVQALIQVIQAGIYDAAGEDPSKPDSVTQGTQALLQDFYNQAVRFDFEPEDAAIYRAGGKMTPTQNSILEAYGSGGSGGGKSITKRGSAPSPEVEAMFKKQIETLDAQIQKATSDYEQAEVEFKSLLRGPDYNMALAPVARRPTRFTEIVEDFGRLNRVDPSFARDVLDAGDEPGLFEGPKPYEELLAVRGAAGKSPFDFVLDQSDMIFKMSGDLGMRRELTDSDAQLILSNVGRMAKTVESPMFAMFDDGQFGKMSFDNKQYGFSTGFSTLKEIATRALNDPKPKERIAAANYVLDTLERWEGSLSKEQIESASRASQPTAVISGYIREATDAYDRFLETRNASEYRKALSDSYNKVAATEPEIRGLVGDAFLNEVERYSAVDESERLPEELNFKLTGLRDTADELSARNVLTLPELPEVDITGTRGPTGRVKSAEDFEVEMGD